jgi:hypothetical protein
MRINFLGGPNSKKSTTAAWIFSELKRDDISVELVSEFCKTWAIEKRVISKWDQTYFFGQQMQAEYHNLKHGIKNIITDSPVFLAPIYADKYSGKTVSAPLFKLSHEFDKDFPCINIFLERGDKKYIIEGRYENYDQALEMDLKIKSKAIYEYEDGKQLFFANYDDREKIKEIVYKNIEK